MTKDQLLHVINAYENIDTKLPYSYFIWYYLHFETGEEKNVNKKEIPVLLYYYCCCCCCCYDYYDDDGDVRNTTLHSL
jgi:hypothetical protein